MSAANSQMLGQISMEVDGFIRSATGREHSDMTTLEAVKLMKLMLMEASARIQCQEILEEVRKRDESHEGKEA